MNSELPLASTWGGMPMLNPVPLPITSRMKPALPSTVMACDLCAGVMGSAVLKVLLGRGPLRAAPWTMQFDAFRQRLAFTWRPFGNANPLQQLMLMLIRPRLQLGA